MSTDVPSERHLYHPQTTIPTTALRPGHVMVDYRKGRHVVAMITGPTELAYTVSFTDGDMLPFGIDAQVVVEHIAVGTAVRLAREVRFASRTFYAGESAVVTAVHCLPAGIVEGDTIYEAAVVDGVYVDCRPAFSISLPLSAGDVDGGTPRP